MTEITAERVREVLSYDPETGVFTWIKFLSSHTRIGAQAGSKHNQGYLMVRIDGRLYLCHRLAWLYMNGHWPDDQIDHINGNRSDNRIVNLRPCTNQQNCQNVRAHKDGSGALGACFDKRIGRWQAGIGVNGKRVFLGNFDTKEDAHAAYLKAKTQLHEFGAPNV